MRSHRPSQPLCTNALKVASTTGCSTRRQPSPIRTVAHHLAPSIVPKATVESHRVSHCHPSDVGPLKGGVRKGRTVITHRLRRRLPSPAIHSTDFCKTYASVLISSSANRLLSYFIGPLSHHRFCKTHASTSSQKSSGFINPAFST